MHLRSRGHFIERTRVLKTLIIFISFCLIRYLSGFACSIIEPTRVEFS